MTAFINQSDPNILIPYVITSKDFRDNSSLLEEAPTLTTSASVKATVLCVMAVASLIGNLATLISIAVSKKGTSSSLYTLLFQVFSSVSVICNLVYRLHCCTHTLFYANSITNKLHRLLCTVGDLGPFGKVSLS